MVKKTGSIFFLFFVIVNSLFADDARIQIRFKDLQGNLLKQAESNVPFCIEVIAHNIDVSQAPQGFEQWQDCSVSSRGTTSSMNSINGKISQSTIFQYIAIIEQKGLFNFSPLKIIDQSGKLHVSDSVTIKVSDDAQVVESGKTKPYLLVVDVDKKSIYVGEKLSVLLRFGYQQSFTDLRISLSELSGFHQGYVADQPQAGTFTYGGQKYDSKDYAMELYPEKTGRLVIPSFYATFAPEISQQSIHHMFSLVMGAANNTVQSQPKSIEVKSLPKSDLYEGVTAVGSFDSIDFKLSSSKGKVGEGLIATMTVVGDGNLHIAQAPALKMDDKLHYYEGNSKVTQTKNNKMCKEFEWIVQAESAGDFIICAQEFVYFDPKVEEYKSLKTQPLKISITGQENKIAMTQEPKQHEIEQPIEQPIQNLDDVKEKQKNSDDQKIFFDTWLQIGKSSVLLTWLIQMLLLLLFIVLVSLGLKKYESQSFFLRTFKIRLAFMQSCHKKDIHGVYRLFEKLMHQYDLKWDSAVLADSFNKLGLPEESFQNWKNFVNMIWEMNFAKDRATDQTELAFSLAKQWFAIILSSCKLHQKKQGTKQVV